MAETLNVTDYSPYIPFANGTEGISEHSSALTQLFADVPALQQDTINLFENMGDALKIVPALTDPKDFLALGWTDTNGLPDAEYIPIIYISDGTNLWLSRNDPSIDLGDGTEGTGTAWLNIYAQSNTINVLANHTSLTDTLHNSTSYVDITDTEVTVTINATKNVRIMLSGFVVRLDENGIVTLDIDGTTYDILSIGDGVSRYFTYTKFFPAGTLSGSTTFKLKSIRTGSNNGGNPIRVTNEDYQMTIEEY